MLRLHVERFYNLDPLDFTILVGKIGGTVRRTPAVGGATSVHDRIKDAYDEWFLPVDGMFNEKQWTGDAATAFHNGFVKHFHAASEQQQLYAWILAMTAQLYHDSVTVAHRRLLDVRRRRSLGRTAPRGPAGAIEARPAPGGDETAVSSRGTDPAIGLITSSLSPEEADVVLLRVIGDLDVDAVAGIVGTRPSDVRSMQHRAVRRLASVLETEGVTR